MRSRALFLIVACLLRPSPGSSDPVEAEAVAAVSVGPDSFNPKLGQKTTLEFVLVHPGLLSVSLLDRSGAAVRTLPALHATPGKVPLIWDGRNDQGVVVPDDAYSISARLDGEVVYEPRRARRPNEAPVAIYSRVGGLITYTLKGAAYVTLSAVQDAVKEGSRPLVLKTIIDREPRVAGSIVETWTGFGAAGEYLPEVKGFRFDLAAEPLPENALITIGSGRRAAGRQTTSTALEKRGGSSTPVLTEALK
jgi:hypothetical protein